MKRCPQCEFIYPDSDRVCDFDQTTLVDATESEIAQITNTPERLNLSDLAATHSRNFAIRKSKKALPIAAASGLIFGIAIVSGYLTMQRLSDLLPVADIGPIAINTVNVIPPANQTNAIAKLTTSEQKSLAPKSDTGNAQKTPTQNRSNSGPISTSTTDNKSKSQVIVLTTGNKVEADQVWRTRDGIWYRKNGMITLLKKNQVKSIIER